VSARVDPRSWAAPRPSALHRYLPITMWLPRYEYRRDLRFDLIAGATLWGLLVPEMIAYAGLAGLPPQAGLYTLLATLAAYAVFGTSRHVVVAGTSAAAVLLASTVGEVAVGQDDYLANAAALVLFVGGLSLLAGVCRLGFIAQFLSRPVVEGFVFGLAIFVTVKQLPKLFGISGGEGDTFRQLGHVIAHLGDTNGPTLVIGAAALALLFGLERFAANVPGGLVALVLGIVVSGAFDLSTHGVAIVGKVPSGFPSVSVPSFASENVPTLIAAAGGMLLVIFSESLGAAQNFATKHGYEIDPNQELIALGVANAGSGFVGGLAAGGSLSQSAVNEGAGARSEVSPLVAALLMVVTVLVLMPVFKNLPEAVLAALIIHAVSHLWKVEEFRRYYGVRRIEFLLGLATLLGVITIDVLPGLIIGVVSMLVLVIYRASRPHLSVLGRVAGVPGAYGDIGRHPDYEQVPDLLVLRLDSPLFYANASLVRDRIKRTIGACDPLPKAVILDLGANDELDITSIEQLEHLIEELRAGGIHLALADLRQPVLERIRRSGLLDLIGPEHVYLTVDEAVRAEAAHSVPTMTSAE
jgi:sulfate permease, SulP family